MRASRLLSLLLLLQTRGDMTATQIAAELEVSVRTVYRDVEELSAAGVPVYAERGPLGGYRLLDGYRTRLNGLTPAEASSLFLAGLPGPAAELGLADLAAAAELKLLAALPPEPRSQAARMRERFHFDVPGWYQGNDEAPFLTDIAEAVWDDRVVRMRYRRWGPAEVERTLHPYGLILKGGAWYLAAACSGSVRTYRVSRILEAEVLDECFERPPDFDLAGFWRRFAADFAARMYTGHAVVRLQPGIEDLLRYTLGRDVVDKALAGGLTDPDGWTRVTLPVESLNHARWQLLRLGASVEVVEPAELRTLMADTISELSRLYG
ncbi:helix-turn-helix transcriptional regulator [Sphaerimonospora thailandensis]|uniref:Transcriptional regulator n=1 Tax=Sphaerimonospora thailandensis TaxID=795644 RepID=A0A8J3RA42_9ACTN|nr:transcriptional regulator [Sphaerimonospora thailandensis]GIH71932.1 transcriptional regulator [Sphaerimonospora thailandensis]